MRTTSVLETKEGSRIFSAGAKRDLSPSQRAVLQSNEVAAKMLDAHAEVTALGHVAENGLTPSRLEVSRDICVSCAAQIEATGGRLISPRIAEW